jgi:hypothetical protein
VKRWNPFFVAYAHCHGLGPAQMLKHDRKHWPGGCMCGFMVWMRKRWDEWHELKGLVRYKAILARSDYDDFSRWLSTETFERIS